MLDVPTMAINLGWKKVFLIRIKESREMNVGI